MQSLIGMVLLLAGYFAARLELPSRFYWFFLDFHQTQNLAVFLGVLFLLCVIFFGLVFVPLKKIAKKELSSE